MTGQQQTLRCRGWQQEAALRMLENNLQPDVAERPEGLVVYGGIGKAARNRAAYETIRRELTGSRTMKCCWCNPGSRWRYLRPRRMLREC